MPARSKAQAGFMGLVRGVKEGTAKSASPKAKAAAKSMSMPQVKEFNRTRHTGLPARVKGD